MATCFLFINNQFDQNNCLSLKLNAQGQLDAPLLNRNLADFKSIQENARTWVILSAERVGLHDLELPWLAERKARVAIPFALEEEVAQSLSSLHFIFDKAYYQQNRYLIAVIDKLYFSTLVNQLDENEIDFERITLDWFALDTEEVCITNSALLANTREYKGALSLNLADYFFSKYAVAENEENSLEILLFEDSASIELSPTVKTRKVNESMPLWVAQRLFSKKPMNFCQGEFEKAKEKSKTKLWYSIAATAFAVWFLSGLVINLVQLRILNSEHEKLDKQIATIYYQFFPEAKQVISPRFRISNLLEKGNKQKEVLWELLPLFANYFNGNVYSLEQIRFQNNLLAITLLSQDFASLETLQTQLKNAGINVAQTQASTQDQQVLATLDLSL